MARLKHVQPLAHMVPSDMRSLPKDDRIDGSPAGSTFIVRNGDGTQAADLDWDASTGTVRLAVRATIDNSALQRVNRLLDGSGYRLRTYHRAGNALRMHGAGTYATIPGTIILDTTGRFAYEPVEGVPTVASPAPVLGRTVCAYCSDPFTEPSVGHKCPERAEVTEPVVVEPEPEPEPVEALRMPERIAVPGEVDILDRPTPGTTPDVKVKAPMREGLDRLWDLHVAGSRQVLALIGPTGTGKTSLVYSLAARKGVGIFNFDCAGAREFSDFVGVTHLRGEETVFVPSALLQVIDAEGEYAGVPRIVNLDEITRAESSGALNALIPMLHGFASIYVPEAGKTFKVDPKVMFTATANRGSQYAGTVGMDLALANRITAWVKMNYADESTEATLLVERAGVESEQAQRLVGAAQRIRTMAERGELPEGGGVSTRLLIEAAIKVKAGFTLHEAASWTWVGNYPDEGGTSSEAYQVQSAIDYSLRS
jgi:hypothetical protein